MFLTSSVAYSQFYQIRNFNAENGLPSPEVYGLIQDSKGFMWFATDMGVSRYDGNEFKNFSTENGLPDNTVFGFCEDAKQRIWFRSFSGRLSYFLNDSIQTLPCNSLLEDVLRKKTLVLTSIYVDKADTIWIGTTDKLVIKISPPWNQKNVTWIDIPENGAYMYLLNDKKLVFGGLATKNCNVTVYSKDLKKICQVDSKEKEAHRYYATILKDGNFLASVNCAILKFNKGGILSSTSQKSTVITLLEDKNNKFISASYNGIHIHDLNNLEIKEVIPDFSDKIFTDIIIDKENSLWLATEGHGVYYIPFRNGRYYTTEHGLTQSKISCIAEKDGNIITGHLNGSVSVIKGNAIKTLNFIPQKKTTVASSRVYCINNYKDRLFVFNSEGSFKLENNFADYKEANISVGVKKMIKSRGDTTWVLGARRISHYSFLYDNFKKEKDIFFNQYIDDIYEDEEGTLWICAMNGLWNYKNNVLHYLGDTDPLLSSRIVNILTDSKGRLWMATRGKGLIVKIGAKFHNITMKQGLASNMCRNIYADSNDVVWVGSNNGLSKIIFENNKLEINIYSKKHGLLSNEVNYIIGRGKELILAHNNGISIINPSSLKNNSVPPPIYITSVIVTNKIYKKDSLQLNFSQNYFKINYIGLSYKNPGSVEYRYKMEGLDTSWVYTGYTSAQFQTLYPGDYKFIVYAKNNDGFWSEIPAVLYLSILPAWWQTWTFIIAVLLILIGIVYAIVKRRLVKIKKREQEKAVLQSKIALTELKALRAQMNPHFVFNAINSVQHFITSNDPDSSQKYLSKFAKLIRYVVDNSKPTSIPLEKEIEAIRLFLDLETMRFDEKFQYSIYIDKKIDVNFIQIPSMLIQPYIENSIWHGIMHKKGAGKIDIRFELLDHTLKCTVEDNGIGRKKSQEYKDKQSIKTHKSVGMDITKERLEIINQINKSSLSVLITDLIDEKGNALGTKVELFIPSF